MRRLVDELGFVFQFGVDFDYFTAYRTKYLGNSLNRLHRTKWFVRFKCVADLRQVNVNDIPKFVLSVIRDTYDPHIPLDEYPLVILCVKILFRIHRLTSAR